MATEIRDCYTWGVSINSRIGFMIHYFLDFLGVLGSKIYKHLDDST